VAPLGEPSQLVMCGSVDADRCRIRHRSRLAVVDGSVYNAEHECFPVAMRFMLQTPSACAASVTAASFAGQDASPVRLGLPVIPR
jgi:hypothetical protein